MTEEQQEIDHSYKLVVATRCQAREFKKNPDLIKKLFGEGDIKFCTDIVDLEREMKVRPRQIFTTGHIGWMNMTDIELPKDTINDLRNKYGLEQPTRVQVDFI